MSIFSSLNRSRKEAVGLLQVGTFLEYLDLMLYVHMAVFINELFFCKTDFYSSEILAAFSFCSSFALRPLGALFFGYLGDRIGRKSTVIITTAMMSCSCICLANVSTYAQIGVAASWIVTIARMLQGFASLGEMVNAEVYLTEITKPPERYPIVALIPTMSVVGSTVALSLSYFFTSYTDNWRSLFWVGSSIALLGSVARFRLRETSDFLEARAARKKNEKTKKIISTLIAYSLISVSWPLFFFVAYVYCGNILKSQFGFTSSALIGHNLIVTLLDLITVIAICFASYRIFPLKILRYRWMANIFLVCALPFLLESASTPIQIGFLQCLCLTFGLSSHPGFAVFFVHFPVLKRCSYIALIYASAHSFMYVITSFGSVYLSKLMGHFALWVFMIPLSIGFYWGLRHFEKLETKKKL